MVITLYFIFNSKQTKARQYGLGYGLRLICRATVRCRALVLEPYLIRIFSNISYEAIPEVELLDDNYMIN